MREFSSIDQLIEYLPELPTDPRGGFRYEADWLMDGGGMGVPGGRREARWLVTYAHTNPVAARAADLVDDPDEGAAGSAGRGWLVAYELAAIGGRTGRCAVLAGPWNPYEDVRRRREAIRQPWWTSTGADVDELLRWLRS